MNYDDMRQRRREKRQEEYQRDESDLDSKLDDGFALLQDDDDVGDNDLWARGHSSLAESQFEHQKKRRSQ